MKNNMWHMNRERVKGRELCVHKQAGSNNFHFTRCSAHNNINQTHTVIRLQLVYTHLYTRGIENIRKLLAKNEYLAEEHFKGCLSC
jgi:hypothetical protein